MWREASDLGTAATARYTRPTFPDPGYRGGCRGREVVARRRRCCVARGATTGGARRASGGGARSRGDAGGRQTGAHLTFVSVRQWPTLCVGHPCATRPHRTDHSRANAFTTTVLVAETGTSTLVVRRLLLPGASSVVAHARGDLASSATSSCVVATCQSRLIARKQSSDGLATTREHNSYSCGTIREGTTSA